MRCHTTIPVIPSENSCTDELESTALNDIVTPKVRSRVENVNICRGRAIGSSVENGTGLEAGAKFASVLNASSSYELLFAVYKGSALDQGATRGSQYPTRTRILGPAYNSRAESLRNGCRPAAMCHEGGWSLAPNAFST